MAFSKSGMSVPMAFTKRKTDANFKQYPRDYIVVLKEVHPAADGQGSLIVSEKRNDGTERVYNVRIKKETLERLKKNQNVNTTTRKWSGGLIDDSFDKEFSPEDVLILEQALFAGPKKTINGVETYFIEANWIHSADPDEAKNFRARYTVSTYNGRVSGVRTLPDRNISVNDQESIQEIRTQLNEIQEAVANGEFVPGLSISFHTLVPTVLKSGRDAGKDGKKEIDRTAAFSWVAAQKDNDGQVITEGHLITTEVFDELLEGYIDYIYGPEDGSSQGMFPEDILKDVQVEIMVGVNYRASQMSDSLVINPQYTGAPLYRLANTETKYSISDEGYIKSQNIAVDGIVMLSADKMEKVGREAKIIRRDLVTRLFTNGPIKDASELVLSADGLQIEVDERLKAPNNYSNNSSSAGTETKTEERTEEVAKNDTPVDNSHAFDIPDDPFADNEKSKTSGGDFDDNFFNEDEDFFKQPSEKESTETTSRPTRHSRRDV